MASSENTRQPNSDGGARSRVRSPLRVVHVVPPAFGYTFSGITKRIVRLLSEWREPGIELSLWGTDFFDRHTHADLWTGGGPRHTRGVRLLWSLRLAWMLIRKRREYDLVHVHILWWGGLLAPVVARLAARKAIYEMSLLGSDNPSALALQSVGRLKKWLFSQYHGVIGLTPALIDDCRRQRMTAESMVLPGYLLFEAPEAPNPTRRRRARRKLGISSDAIVLIFVGSIIERKGVDTLVSVYLELARKLDSLWLLLVGAKDTLENPRLDEDFVEAQRRRLSEAGVLDRVVWAGLVRDETELVDCYLASDIFAFPSRAEGQGYVIVEAMACGLPVVCSRLPGVTDTMVLDGKTGYLVPPDDLEGFTSAVALLLDNPELRARMGAAGRARAVENFGFDAYCAKLAAFYRRVALGPAGAAPSGGRGTV